MEQCAFCVCLPATGQCAFCVCLPATTASASASASASATVAYPASIPQVNLDKTDTMRIRCLLFDIKEGTPNLLIPNLIPIAALIPCACQAFGFWLDILYPPEFVLNPCAINLLLLHPWLCTFSEIRSGLDLFWHLGIFSPPDVIESMMAPYRNIVRLGHPIKQLAPSLSHVYRDDQSLSLIPCTCSRLRAHLQRGFAIEPPPS